MSVTSETARPQMPDWGVLMEWTDNRVWTCYIAGRWHWWDEETAEWLKT